LKTLNHPENPDYRLLTTLWLKALGGDEVAYRQYFRCLQAATYSDADRHLRVARVALVDRKGR
jgi:hypothetical protein